MATDKSLGILIKSIRAEFGASNVPDWLINICLKRAEALVGLLGEIPKDLSFNQMYDLILKSGTLKQALNEVRSDAPNKQFADAASASLKAQQTT